MKHIKELIKQCELFRNEQLTKSKEEIYDKFYTIRFYEEIKEYLISFLDYDEDSCEVKELEEVLRNRSMSELFDDFLSYEYSSIDNWESLRDFLEMK